MHASNVRVVPSFQALIPLKRQIEILLLTLNMENIFAELPASFGKYSSLTEPVARGHLI